MQRRDFLASVGGLAVASVASRARAEAPPPHVHKGGKSATMTPMSKELRAVVDATSHCLGTGEACVVHCNRLLGEGDTSLAECQRTVLNMLALCGATFKAASYNTADAKNLKALARVCADFCRACAKACEPHAAHHQECKDCFDSCNDCLKACDAYAAT